MQTLSTRLTIALSLAALLAETSGAQTSKITPHVLDVFSGSSPAASLSVPRFVGDVNSDGIEDHAYGSPLHDGAGTDAGLVQVVSGSDNTVLWSAAGGSPGDLLGWALARIGDLNGDGIDELVIGAPGSATGNSPGQVTVHSGADGTILHTFSGTSAGDGFGFAVDGAGDYDLDGKEDILVGAPREDANGVDSGAAYVFSGATSQLLAAAAGSAAADQFGAAVKGLAPAGVFSAHDPGIIIGATWGGPADQGSVQFRNGTDFGVDQTVTGAATSDQFGISLAIPGDLNGDGTLDVLIGADPVDGNGASTGSGYARVHSGSDGSLLSTVNGSPGAAFGRALGGIGDMNGDGVPDWAVGAPLDDVNGAGAGSLFVYSGADAALLHVLRGGAGSQLGSAVCHAGDLDDDNLADLMVSAPLDDTGGTDQGAVIAVSFTRFATAGSGVAGTNGVPTVHNQGTLQPLSPLTLEMALGREVAGSTLIRGPSLIFDSGHQIFVPLPVEITSGLITDSSGRLEVIDTWPAGFAPGTLVYWQFRVLDPQAANGEALSQLISGVTP